MKIQKRTKRNRRKMHIRKTLRGNAQKPRVYVFKSNSYLYSGVTDDVTGKVLGSARASKSMKGAQDLGKKVAEMLKKKMVKGGVFDRSGYKYHGIIAKYADSLRENGLKI